MTDENKVYIVSSGEYSDWDIAAVFSTKEKAEAYKNSSDRFNKYIVEMVIDKPFDFPVGKKAYRVSFSKDGASFCGSYCPESVDNKTTPSYSDRMDTNCWATDEKHAIEIANERRTQIIANNMWDTDVKAYYARQRLEDNK